MVAYGCTLLELQADFGVIFETLISKSMPTLVNGPLEFREIIIMYFGPIYEHLLGSTVVQIVGQLWADCGPIVGLFVVPIVGTTVGTIVGPIIGPIVVSISD